MIQTFIQKHLMTTHYMPMLEVQKSSFRHWKKCIYYQKVYFVKSTKINHNFREIDMTRMLSSLPEYICLKAWYMVDAQYILSNEEMNAQMNEYRWHLDALYDTSK